MSQALEHPAIGYRLWRVAHGELLALDGAPWPVGDVAAACRADPSHYAPRPDCECGLYAWHDRPPSPPAGFVLGAVAAWGTIEVHSSGFRAQHAAPIALARNDQLAEDDLTEAARRYKVPLVDTDALAAIASEFGSVIPWAERPADSAALLAEFAASLWRRERCWPSLGVSGWTADAFADHARVRVPAASRRTGDMAATLLAIAQVRAAGTSNDDLQDPEELTDAIMADLSRIPATASGRSAVPGLLHALDAVHGPVRSAVADLASRGVGDHVPLWYLFHASFGDQQPPRARELAKRALAADRDRLLPSDAVGAVLCVADELTDEQVATAAGRLRSSVDYDRLLTQLSDRAAAVATLLLARDRGLGIHAAASVLGQQCRPALLRHLRDEPPAFSVFHPEVREIVGDQELRLAAERAMRNAGDPQQVASALKLFPSDEAREPLRQMSMRLRGMRTKGPNTVIGRAWNAICSTQHLIAMLEPAVVEHALNDLDMHPTNHVLLLRAHPQASAAAALRLWRTGGLYPRLALDVLRAAGGHQARLVEQALAEVDDGPLDRASAPQAVAATVVAFGAETLSKTELRRTADNSTLPAALRVVAAHLGGVGPTALADDPAMRRYRRWLDHHAGTHHQALDPLLSGGWLHDVLP